MKKKILIYIEDDLYIRNYFTSDIFEFKDYDVSIYASDNVTQRHILQFNRNFKGYLHENGHRTKIRNLQFSIQLYKYKNLSKSFEFRYHRFEPSLFSKVILWLSTRRLTARVITFFLIQLRLKENSEIKSILKNERPDLVIAPSQVVGSISLDIIEICNSLNIKTFFLIDGWDNISSKTIFPSLPTCIAVWGQQSVEHAIKIQKFPRERIFTIGTPRFEFYRNQTKKSTSPYNFKYVVFTGCAIPFDEISVLKILDYTLTKHNIDDVKIIYRPHPWRQVRKCFDFFVEQDFKNVIMDEQMKEYYYCTKIMGVTNAIQPSLDYYPPLLTHCLFTISPLTTMIIEAAIVNKYVLTLAYDDGYHYTNPQNALRNYEHFVGIENITAFKFCYNLKELPKTFLSLLQQVQTENNINDFSDQIKYIIDLDTESYIEKINNIVNRMLP